MLFISASNYFATYLINYLVNTISEKSASIKELIYIKSSFTKES